jgi:hypothetical protein
VRVRRRALQACEIGGMCVCGRCVRARAGAGRMRAPPALELDLLVRRAAQGRSRPRGARGAGRGRRPPPRKPLRSAACWTCAGRCAIPGSCERAQRPAGPARGQALQRHIQRDHHGLGATKNAAWKGASLAQAHPHRPAIEQNSRSLFLCACTAALHHLPEEKRRLNFRCKKLQKTLRRGGEGNEAGSYLMRTAVRAWRKPGGLRFWAALGLQRVLLELPFVGLGQQAGHLGAACRSGSTS